MLWLVFTSGKCNLVCDYCGGSFEKTVVPWSVKYDIKKIKGLIERDPKPTVIFYGGEPLSNPKFIETFMDEIKATRYGIQTNGTLVKLLPENYWRRINVALLSIDGRREVTDKHRGKGIYDRVIKNAGYLKSLGVETIARMTVTMDSDILMEVSHLLETGVFDKIHWQLNIVWTDRWDVETWSKNVYLPGIRSLVDLFASNLERGKVLKIIPILGVISAHYFGGYRGSPCGAGYNSVSVTTDGRILSCPIAVREKWAELGDVNSGFSLMDEPLPKECMNCEFKRYCGGRCLYASKEKYWGEEGFKITDEINKEYLRTVLSLIPKIDQLLKKGVISLSDLRYDPTQDSTEVIP
ncbi:radical SAM/SPASM domain-containing protein [Metallosphaera tengchongensis]|uniref:Radical SAM/SPASM domain-containing protein n=1 Tax=Metallosphaera tengchongensis TaxID=1532350 RepID=A0A6N0NU96_9CREN|nr:radical SAM/SPASM domain-containing protein [Metallosphaera tengchongensis]QKR00366.1 radical SAM/SPASM domain-containing protein [Metallosphaera tengchongensis]